MLLANVKKFYEEFEKDQGLTSRRGQRIGSAFFALPLYGEITTVVGEGQTGMGKTISYLAPIAMYRLGMLPEVPSFILKHEDNLFLKEKRVEDVIIEMGLIEEAENVLKEVRKPSLGKVYVITATKMLQNQIINKDLKKVNDFLQKKGVSPLKHSVLVGKKNYVCLESVSRVANFLGELKEAILKARNEAELKGLKESLADLESRNAVVDELREKVNLILKEKISSFDDLLKVFKKREIDAFFDKLEEVFEWREASEVKRGISWSPKTGIIEVFSPHFGLRHFLEKVVISVPQGSEEFGISDEVFESLIKKVYDKVIKNGGVDELFSVNYATSCRRCSKAFQEVCEFFQSLKDLSEADVFIMNYYYFVSVFAKVLGGLRSVVEALEKKLGLPVSKWGRSSLEKALKAYEASRIGKSSEFEVEKAIEVLLWYKSVYEKYYKQAFFVFDEAHVFERDVLSSGVKSVDLKEAEKVAKKLKEKLADVFRIVEVPVWKTASTKFWDKLWEEKLAKLAEKGYKEVAFYHTILSRALEKVKSTFGKREESVTCGEFLFFLLKSFLELAEETKAVYYQDFLETATRKLAINLVSRVKATFPDLFDEFDHNVQAKMKMVENLKNAFLSRILEDLSKIKGTDSYDNLPFSTRVTSSLLSLLVLDASEVLGRATVLKKDVETFRTKDASPSLLVAEIALNKFPARKVDFFYYNYFEPMVSMLESGVKSGFLKEASEYFWKGRVEFLREGIFNVLYDFLKEHGRSKELEKRIDTFAGFLNVNLGVKSSLAKRKQKAIISQENVVFFDGLTLNEISGTVDGIIKKSFPDWGSVRKVFTSATLTSGYVDGVPSFSFFLRSVGIKTAKDREKTRAFVVASPFNYKENSLFYLPDDVPHLKEGTSASVSETWKSYVTEKLKEVIFYAKGGVLVLSTSNELVYHLRENLKEFFKQNDVEVFVQGYTPLREIQARFGKVDPNEVKQVLIAGPLFWQGFDVPGEGLTHVVILKLPFFEPDNPYNVMVTRREYENLLRFYVEKKGLPWEKAHQLADKYVFQNVIIPAAVLQFRQGVGRLIRTETDRGLVTCFDDRLVTKKYGEKFAQMLAMPYTRKKEDVFAFLKKTGLLSPRFEEKTSAQKSVEGVVRLTPAFSS